MPRQSCRESAPVFPRTRYQGSKRKLAAAIVAHTRGLEFTTVLDAFGGTGAVSHAFKRAGKAVTYNDILAFNHQIGRALIENDERKLSHDELQWLIGRHADVTYGDTIERLFDGIYYPRAENRWLDMVVANIQGIADESGKALAWHALFQAAMAKRPYNLFHRRNLYMREADVPRSFGNKTTWEKPFAEHFKHFAREANMAVFRGEHACRAIRVDAMSAPTDFDLVYIDPPYMNARGQSVDYRHFYHFLEGMMDYDCWSSRIDFASKHRRLLTSANPWSEKDSIRKMFWELLSRFNAANIVVSYRSDGVPSIEELTSLVEGMRRKVAVIKLSANPYVLSTNQCSAEVLMVMPR